MARSAFLGTGGKDGFGHEETEWELGKIPCFKLKNELISSCKAGYLFSCHLVHLLFFGSFCQLLFLAKSFFFCLSGWPLMSSRGQ